VYLFGSYHLNIGPSSHVANTVIATLLLMGIMLSSLGMGGTTNGTCRSLLPT
jgi:hypothetical protein